MTKVNVQVWSITIRSTGSVCKQIFVDVINWCHQWRSVPIGHHHQHRSKSSSSMAKWFLWGLSQCLSSKVREPLVIFNKANIGENRDDSEDKQAVDGSLKSPQWPSWVVSRQIWPSDDDKRKLAYLTSLKNLALLKEAMALSEGMGQWNSQQLVF